ncbi:M81 family metallopeptidase [Pseudogracilibacillus sp. SO30301A]|uniref:M81 family metallopeptidase n=1 Tax=Pseudogracilibacillus sp. SO30301A TaxID=3098291 RepID=UPI00300E2B3F
MKVAIGQIFHETNTFSNNKTTIELFKHDEWLEGNAIIKHHDHTRTFLGGMISSANDHNVDLKPIFSAECNPSGVITKSAYQKLKKTFINNLKKVGYIDAICLSLHGAGIVEETEDLEGDFLKTLRTLLGNDIPIIVSLDLHANVTNEMVERATALIGVKQYPHIDCYETGKKAMTLLVQTIKQEVFPVMEMIKLPFIMPLIPTDHPVIQKINEECTLITNTNDDIIDCTFYHGFHCTDISFVGVSLLCITNERGQLAKKVAKEMAKKIWENKDDLYVERYSAEEAINLALGETKYPVIINETSDNPGGGAPGDGTRLLEKLIDRNIKDSCFGFIYDPEVANLAHEMGVGSLINTNLGGKTDTYHGEPIKIKGYVKLLTDGRFTHTSPMHYGKKVNYGKTALIKVDNVDIIVCSFRAQTHDEQIFLLHGIKVSDYRIVCLKSSHHFKAGFKNITKKTIPVDSGGLSSNNLESFTYQKINRPIYPIDKMYFNKGALINGS